LALPRFRHGKATTDCDRATFLQKVVHGVLIAIYAAKESLHVRRDERGHYLAADFFAPANVERIVAGHAATAG
jgi:hypothetical protein